MTIAQLIGELAACETPSSLINPCACGFWRASSDIASRETTPTQKTPVATATTSAERT
ncbi:MAG: hypothetical protein JHC83_00710 [Thermoleophilia bacterium]|nr:hypothetical protein [Thermoleophilia bacterium]